MAEEHPLGSNTPSGSDVEEVDPRGSTSGGESREEARAEAESAKRLLRKARTQMLLKWPFFGSLALHLQLRAEPGIGTAGTDGERFYYSPKFIHKVSREDGEAALMGLVAHETMHAALGHIWRRGSRHKMLFNVACDYAINYLIREASLALPSGGLHDDELGPLSAEEIYAKLIERYGEPPETQGWGEHEPWERGMGSEGDGEGSGSESGAVAAEAAGGSGSGSDGEGEGGSEDADSAASRARESQRRWKDRLAAAAASARQSRGQGSMPASLARRVEEALEPVVDWREVLARFAVPAAQDYSFMPPDRRFLDYDLVLPDFTGESLEDIVVAVDTSGSIDNRRFSAFVAEVQAIMAAFPGTRGTLVFCDAAVQNERPIEEADEADLDSITEGAAGLGGTDFRPVFDLVDERGVEPAALIYLTDGMGSYPDSEPPYPVLWALTDDEYRHPEIEPPFGAMVRLPAEQ